MLGTINFDLEPSSDYPLEVHLNVVGWRIFARQNKFDL